jgi:predicted membrane-bound mannosyltransferase
MYQTLPRELALDAASVRACHESRRYWQYRLVRASILASLDRRDIRFLANGDVVRALGGAIVDVASRIAARIIRR